MENARHCIAFLSTSESTWVDSEINYKVTEARDEDLGTLGKEIFS